MGQSLNITLTGVSMLSRFYAHICNTPFIKWILVILRLYSRVVQCEIRKIEVYDIDFSRPSPDIKSGRGIHCNYRFGSDYVAISRNRAFTAPKPESPIRRYRAEAALNGPVTDRRASTFTRRFRAVRVRHASIRPNLSRPRGVGPN
jgi:hypothetical protein